MNAYRFYTETNPVLLDVPCDVDGESFRNGTGQNWILDGYQRLSALSKTFEPTDSAPARPCDRRLTRRITNLRTALQALFRVQSITEGKQGLVALFIEVQWFTGFANAQGGLAALGQLGAALEKHIADMHHDSAVIDSSTRRRLARAVDLMISMIQTDASPSMRSPTRNIGRDAERQIVPGDN